ncbi:family 43 glycosylhydrolase [Cellulomonas sp. NPDC055163]
MLPGCYPDPSFCRAGEDYYLVTSTFDHLPGSPVHRSRDLISWEPVGHAIHRPGQLDLTGVRSSHGLFAPTLRHHDGRFWIVCTLVGQPEGAPGGNVYVAATDPAGPRRRRRAPARRRRLRARARARHARNGRPTSTTVTAHMVEYLTPGSRPRSPPLTSRVRAGRAPTRRAGRHTLATDAGDGPKHDVQTG